MVDYGIDIWKILYPDQAVPEVCILGIVFFSYMLLVVLLITSVLLIEALSIKPMDTYSSKDKNLNFFFPKYLAFYNHTCFFYVKPYQLYNFDFRL